MTISDDQLTSDFPAIAGGTPVKTTPYGKERRYGEEVLQELREALDQGTLFYAHGRKVRQLEEAFALHVGARFAIACSSGTAGIHAALIAGGISPGDEVITAPITDMGTVIPILYQGAVPIFADLDPQTITLSPESVEAAITPRTKAVLAVHLWGNACDLDRLRELCDRHNLLLIEDCAQALGSSYKGCTVGTRGAIGCFSLNEFKHISCGDGGIVVTDDPELATRLRLATDKAYSRDPNVTVRLPAFLAGNYRITELQGAVALAQLRKLDSIVERRQNWCRELNRRLRGLPGLILPTATQGCDPSWWFYPMQVVPDELGADADTFAAAVKAEGVPVGAHYIGVCVYEYPVFTQHSAFERGEHPYVRQEYRKGLCPNAERILRDLVILSVNEAYTKEDLDQTELAIRRVQGWFRAQRSNS
jgi:dTDP-4-amino-4,6-dideoxygalactose transaminase